LRLRLAHFVLARGVRCQAKHRAAEASASAEMKLDVTAFRYVTRDEFRVLTAIEMGMRNHELVPTPLIESIAKVTRGGVYKLIQNLLRLKLVAHDGKKYDGYRMTYHGYDFLALRALVMRGSITGVGRRLGVGKESDVHFCQGPNGEVLALKLHRLGRISFRAIKEKRDYLQHRTHASWMYMARLAALKEYAYMKALKDEGFPVPTPVDQNRHCVLMSFLDAKPMINFRSFNRPEQLLEKLMRLLVRLGRAGIVHGDFNEFNLMIDRDERVTLIDFPQIVHLAHVNAEELFDRDVRSICEFFRKKIGLDVTKYPSFHEVLEEVAKAGGATLPEIAIEGVSREDDALLVAAHKESESKEPRADGEESNSEEDSEAGDEDDCEPERKDEEVGGAADAEKIANGSVLAEAEASPGEGASGANAGAEGFEALLPSGGREALLGGSPDEEAPAEEDGAQRADEGSEDSEASDSDGPGQVTISTGGRATRRKQSAKEARKNLQRQHKQKPAKPNNQKLKETRKAKSEIKEYLG